MSHRQFAASSLADILIGDGAISRREIDAALAGRQHSGLRLDELLTRGGYVTENRIASALSARLGLPLLTFDGIHPTEEALALIPEKAAERLGVMPLSVDDVKISVAMADPLDMEAADEIRLITGREPEISVAARGDLERAAVAYYRVKGSASEAAGSAAPEFAAARERRGDVSEAEAGTAPVVRLVNSLLDQAARERASDIHIEPSEEGTRVRFRIDGRLVRGAEISAALEKEGEQILRRVSGRVYPLCIEGKAVDSPGLAKRLAGAMQSTGAVSFVIGSSYGLSPAVKQAGEGISMSPMTFPHQLARVMLCEQIYRGFQILGNTSYHK